MNLKNSILAYFLILSYTLSFAHSFIPHSDTLIDGQHVHEFTKNHSHSHDLFHSHSTVNHIQHEDHLDEDLYDYLICLFSDLEHGTSECLMEHELPSQFNSSSFVFVIPFISDFFSVEILSIDNDRPITFSDHQLFYTPPLNSSHKLRGPPSLS